MKKTLAIVATAFLLMQPFAAMAQTPAPAPVPTPTSQTAQTQSDCNSVTTCISSVYYTVAVGLTTSLAYMAAFIFDYAIMLSLNSIAYSLGFLTEGWSTVRDIANMAFVFILLYIAIIIMFQAETTGTVRMLVTLVIVALLVNFSFFITRFLIDIGNITASQFYNAIDVRLENGQPATIGNANSVNQATTLTSYASSLTSGISGGQTKDLTAAVMGAIKVTALFSPAAFNSVLSSSGKSGTNDWGLLGQFLIVYTAVGIICILLAATFLFSGIKFIVRIVVLWFAIVFSPLAFIARAVPAFQGGFTKWIDAVVRMSLYPAVYLFMFYIATKFMADINKNSVNYFSNGSLANPAANPTATLGTLGAIFIQLAFVIVVLYLALSAADKFSDYGATVARGFQKFALGGLSGGGIVGYMGRQTLGRIGGSRFGQSAVGQRVGLGSLANRTFDIRNAPGVQGLSRITSKFGLPIDFGTGARSGFGVTRVQTKSPKPPKPTPQPQPNQQPSAQQQGAQGKAQPNATPQAQPQPATAAAAPVAPAPSITSVRTPPIPTGTRIIPGGITNVQAGSTGLPRTNILGGAPTTIASMEKIKDVLEQQKKSILKGFRDAAPRPDKTSLSIGRKIDDLAQIVAQKESETGITKSLAPQSMNLDSMKQGLSGTSLRDVVGGSMRAPQTPPTRTTTPSAPPVNDNSRPVEGTVEPGQQAAE